MKDRIVFKCRFGGKDGWGHVVRCSAIAEAFRHRGWETLLWGSGEFESLPDDVAQAFCGESREGLETSSILFVDEMYTAQSELETLATSWRSCNPTGIVAGVDDMQVRSMAGFDLVLNAEIGLEKSEYEADLVLLGERYAMLRDGFGERKRELDIPAFGDSVPVLVMLGGTDAFGYLPKALDALALVDGPSVVPIVVAGNPRGLGDSLGHFARSYVLGRVGAAELADWMEVCRAAVIACGSSVYEAAALALPFVGLSIVDNQTASARKVEVNWGMPICYCEDGTFVGSEFQEKFTRVLEKPKESYSKVDTLGAERVVEALISKLLSRNSC
ncbi:hypothetical protein [Pelagicoccus sp. SDUM812002]|uniref:hypothetical protein n=1 Tax=Pelagicoccus sp. SDUM812002 TaxID=3041266 RepID=UPI00280F2D41|nr:hypothetical protein [Pelagicoccus sp. SDUM812002]MDQ8186171.1 hypothetical protein [Pelagicoccus sp. SDUM812002]